MCMDVGVLSAPYHFGQNGEDERSWESIIISDRHHEPMKFRKI